MTDAREAEPLTRSEAAAKAISDLLIQQRRGHAWTPEQLANGALAAAEAVDPLRTGEVNWQKELADTLADLEAAEVTISELCAALDRREGVATLATEHWAEAAALADHYRRALEAIAADDAHKVTDFGVAQVGIKVVCGPPGVATAALAPSEETENGDG